jgi:hypothetical protein
LTTNTATEKSHLCSLSHLNPTQLFSPLSSLLHSTLHLPLSPLCPVPIKLSLTFPFHFPRHPFLSLSLEISTQRLMSLSGDLIRSLSLNPLCLLLFHRSHRPSLTSLTIKPLSLTRSLITPLTQSRSHVPSSTHSQRVKPDSMS